MNLKKSFFSWWGSVLFLCMSTVSTQGQAAPPSPTIELNTYYPAPFGIYQTMRLYPSDRPAGCFAGIKGLMYYDDGTSGNPEGEGLYVCDGTDWTAPGSLWKQTDVGGTDNDYLYPKNLNWYIGIGVDNPATALQVNGAISRSGTTVTDPSQINLGGRGFTGNSETAGLWSTVGGGLENKAAADGATVSGGNGNKALGIQSTVAGGNVNKAGANGSFVGGGKNNEIDGIAEFATIAGGYVNRASRYSATISGGTSNSAEGQSSSIVGGENNTANGYFSFIGGGLFNKAEAQSSVVAGGEHNEAGGQFTVVVGGNHNTADGPRGFIGGGSDNTVDSGGVIVAGLKNQASSGSFVGTGDTNLASGSAVFIGAGASNQAKGYVSFIGAGRSNEINVLDASFGNSIVGGERNKIESLFEIYGSAIGGGADNLVTSDYVAVAGGKNNRASGQYSAVAGGQDNQAQGRYAVVAGGLKNIASGDYSFAAGHNAEAEGEGSFVWADNSSAARYTSNGDNTFNVRAKAMYLGGRNVRDYTPHDVAEFMEVLKKDHVQDAELVSAVVSEKLGKSRGAYDPNVMGVVSGPRTNSFYMGSSDQRFEDAERLPIALVGQVYLKVSKESGAIEIGDPITSSSSPGLGMKAEHSGKIVGYALEEENFEDGDIGEILIFVNLGYYQNPNEYVTREEFNKVLGELKALKEKK